MKLNKQLSVGIVSSIVMFMVILDAGTAVNAAEEAIQLCLNTIIPALLPFIVLSTLVSRNLTGYSFRFLRLIANATGVPEGAESLLLLSFAGGYPIGARSVYQSWQNGTLDKRTAQRLLCFCNNAGPAFIFGMGSFLFKNSAAPWLLWGIHIISAVIIGILTPGKVIASASVHTSDYYGPSAAVSESVGVTAQICIWIVIFRVIIGFCNRWFLWLLPTHMQILITGLLELSNGCHALTNVPSEALRFVLFSIILSFGGICVLMQTVTAVGALGISTYIKGKVAQCMMSLGIASVTQYFLYSPGERLDISLALSLFTITISLLFTGIPLKKRVAFSLQI